MQRTNLIFSCLIFLLLTTSGFASDVILREMNGHSVSFASLKGKWVLINYWASWCQPCIEEINELNHFYQSNKDKITLFAVNYDALPVGHQRSLIRQYKINYPSLQDDPARALMLGDIKGVPATFIFNPQGKLQRVLYGSQTLKSLNQAVFELH